MKLAIWSDLHLEFSPWQPPPETAAAADVVVLAGDICNPAGDGLRWARQTFPDKPILFVPGNHEFYGRDLEDELTEMRRVANELDIHMLADDQIEIDGVRFVGAILWTDFALYGPAKAEESMLMARAYMTDFRIIRCGGSERFMPRHSVKLHHASQRYLKDVLATSFPGKTVVVTHHLPSMRSVADRFEGDHLNPSFASHCDELVEQAGVWIHGHTHVACDYMLGRCRVVCNPRGYQPTAIGDGKPEISGWNPELLIEI